MWWNLRTSPSLSSLALETSNALLPPFGSHLVGGLRYEVSGCNWAMELPAGARTLKELSLRSIECRERRRGLRAGTYIAVEMSVVSVEQR
jgi:hypothetical protein